MRGSVLSIREIRVKEVAILTRGVTKQFGPRAYHTTVPELSLFKLDKMITPNAYLYNLYKPQEIFKAVNKQQRTN